MRDMSKSDLSFHAPALLARHLLPNVAGSARGHEGRGRAGRSPGGQEHTCAADRDNGAHRRVVTLDDAATRRGAIEDPTGFVADLQTPAAIDEVQRAPDLLLAIKQSVDQDQRPGRYLLSGSANILTAPTIADALTGRAEYLRLWPFSQAELQGVPPRLVTALFAGTPPDVADAESGRRAHAEMLVAGGFPVARSLPPARRVPFFDSYLKTVLERDLQSVARVHDRANVRRLLEAVAATAGSPLNLDGLSRDLGIPANTIRAHIDLLEMLFLIHRLPAWHSNRLSRLIKAPKLHVIDTGLLAYLLSANAERVHTDGQTAGALFETFVVTEVLRQVSADPDPPRMFHFRDRDGREVDLVLERRDGSVVGIEAKASATAGREDFRGLRLLRERLGDRFAFGALLYTGRATVPFGDRLAAIPLQGLWVDA